MTEKKNYHHGNLHQSLINEATAMIGESGVERLSMRNLALRVGVSRTAAYHHFRNKNELLCAIAEEGFKNWEIHFKDLLEHEPASVRVWLNDFVRAYIDFAQEHMEQYDLMFGRPIWKNGQPTDSLKKESSASFHRYVNFIRHWQEQSVFSDTVDGLRVAQVTMGTMHGISRLLNDGVYIERQSVDAMCQASVEMMVNSVS